MKAKFLSTIITLLFFHFSLSGQVYIGHGGGNGKNRITNEELYKLENTTTVFVYGKKDIPQLENWKKVFADVWQITPVTFVRYDKIGPYLKNQAYSFLTISDIRRFTTIRSPSTANRPIGLSVTVKIEKTDATLSSFYLDLWMCKTLPGDSSSLYNLKKRTLFARIDLFGSDITMSKMMDVIETTKFDRFYQDFIYYNWLPGILKQELKIVNDSINTNKPCKPKGKFADDAELRTLKTEKLFITSDVLMSGFHHPVRLSDFNKGVSDLSKYDTTEIMKFYPYSYQLLSDKELSDKLLGNESFYYLIFIKNALYSCVNVLENPGGKLIYSKWETQNKAGSSKPYNYFSEEDFQKLANEIDKK